MANIASTPAAAAAAAATSATTTRPRATASAPAAHALAAGLPAAAVVAGLPSLVRPTEAAGAAATRNIAPATTHVPGSGAGRTPIAASEIPPCGAPATAVPGHIPGACAGAAPIATATISSPDVAGAGAGSTAAVTARS